MVNVDGSDQRHLTDDWYWNGLPVWSPDRKHLIFVSTRDENWLDSFVLSENVKDRLWVMDADGGSQRPLNDFTFRLDGIPAGVPADQAGGWIEERWFGCRQLGLLNDGHVYVQAGIASRTARRCLAGVVMGIALVSLRLRAAMPGWVLSAPGRRCASHLPS